MPSEPVELKVGGHVYRVVTSADAESLERYAEVVQERLRETSGSDAPQHPQALLLAALALAHDLEKERERRLEVEATARASVRSWVARVGEALGGVDEHGAPLEE